MDSLYNIQQSLLCIFNDIEENDGELTPELDKALTITQENYTTKLENYAKVINQYKDYIASIKKEKERLDCRKKVFENRIARLQDAMLKAVESFGGVETPLFKIGTRKSKSVVIDEDRIKSLNRAVFNFAREIHKNGVIAFGKDCDVQGMLDIINANLKAEYEETNNSDIPFVPFTVYDLMACNVNISSRTSIIDLFAKKDGMLEAVLDNEMYFNVENDNSKTALKESINACPYITIAGIKQENKLSIR